MMQEDSSSDVGDSAGTQMGADGDDITYPSASEAGDAIHPLSGDDEPSIF